MREHESREPFAYIIQDKYERERGVEVHLSRSHVSKYVSQEDINEHEITCMPLYRHAQPAPVVPNEVTAEDCPALVKYDVTEVDEAWARGFNACRAAMLQAEPVTTANKLGNSPVIPDGSASMLRRWLAFGRGMQNAGCQLPHNLIAETEAMLAAAPQEASSESQ